MDLLDEELGAVSEITSGTLTEHDASAISKQVELEEIKLAIKGANPNKWPGPMDLMRISLKCVGLS